MTSPQARGSVGNVVYHNTLGRTFIHLAISTVPIKETPRSKTRLDESSPNASLMVIDGLAPPEHADRGFIVCSFEISRLPD